LGWRWELGVYFLDSTEDRIEHVGNLLEVDARGIWGWFWCFCESTRHFVFSPAKNFLVI
jgi:hypothetical protein